MKATLNSKVNLSLLHGVRGMAALYVVVYHARFILWCGTKEYLTKFPISTWNFADYALSAFDIFFSAGSQMVIIFFVLSGFFITMSLHSNQTFYLHKFRRFYLIRLIRIYIPYLASLVLGTLVLYAGAKISPQLFNNTSNREFNTRLILAKDDISISSFFKALYFTYNKEYIGLNFAYWSLLYEGLFYLITPLVFYFKKYYLIISGLFFFAGIFIINRYHPSNSLLKFIFEYNFYFAIGIMLFFYKNELTNFIQPQKNRKSLLLSCIILFMVFIFFALQHLDYYANLFAAFFASLVILILLNVEVKMNVILKIINQIGELSYSLYLVHIPVLIFSYTLIFCITDDLIIYPRIYMLGVVASLLFSVLFYKFIEKPSLLLINRLKHSSS